MTSEARVFLLSPANLTGVRGRRILSCASGSPFMDALRDGASVPLGDVYEFISSLYYRGKRTYARAFGRRPEGGESALTITPTRGLVPDDMPVDLSELAAFADVDIDPASTAYRVALDATARALDESLGRTGDVVLLGSIATEKYLEPLAEVFGKRLVFPEAFIGRGDMSRGGLLLRAARSGDELTYVPALSAERTGRRPPRLDAR